MKFNSNEDFYKFINILSNKLMESEFLEAGEKLKTILHKEFWTTSSEIFGEIKIVLLKLKNCENQNLPQDLTKDINICLETIEDTWNKSNI